MDGLERVRSNFREWLADAWDPDLGLMEWRARLVDSGWACPSWPEEWFGRGLPAQAAAVVDEELAAAGAVGMPVGVGMSLAAPVIVEFGSDEVKRLLLRATLTGEFTWCQLFSEPGSGSDLAGLTCRADRDGDEWVVNGQKVWNTSAHHADFGLLLARTDWSVPKHAGITAFALPMRQPGVEVRPLRQMNGYASFNEVFLADARIPGPNVIGDEHGGWPIAVRTLALERQGFGAFGRRRADGKGDGRAVREARAEADEYLQTYVWYPQRAGRADLVAPEAQRTGRGGDAVVRQQIAHLAALQRTGQWSAQRGVAASLGKLRATELAREAARAHSAIAGAHGMLTGTDGPLDGVIGEVLLSVPAISIAGGTDEIQRNVIGERVLGLPKEPQVDKDLPFRDVPRNTR